MKTVSDKVVRHSFAHVRAITIGGGSPLLYVKMADNDPTPC